MGDYQSDAHGVGEQDHENNAEYFGRMEATLEKLSCQMAELCPSQERAAAAACKQSQQRQKPPRDYVVRTLSSRNGDASETTIPVLESMRQEIAQLKQVILELCKRAGGLEDGIQSLRGSERATPDRSTKSRGRCLICNDEGHWADRCLTGKVRDGPAVSVVRGKLQCYACGGLGHVARLCTKQAKASIEREAANSARQPAARAWRNRRCYNCHQRGHVQRHCLEVREVGGAGFEVTQEAMHDNERTELPRWKRVGRVTLAPAAAVSALVHPLVEARADISSVEVSVHDARVEVLEEASGEAIVCDTPLSNLGELEVACMTAASVIVAPTTVTAPARLSTESNVGVCSAERCVRQPKGIFSEMRALMQQCGWESWAPEGEAEISSARAIVLNAPAEISSARAIVLNAPALVPGSQWGSPRRREARRGRWNFPRAGGVGVAVGSGRLSRDDHRPVSVM